MVVVENKDKERHPDIYLVFNRNGLLKRKKGGLTYTVWGRVTTTMRDSMPKGTIKGSYSSAYGCLTGVDHPWVKTDDEKLGGGQKYSNSKE